MLSLELASRVTCCSGCSPRQTSALTRRVRRAPPASRHPQINTFQQQHIRASLSGLSQLCSNLCSCSVSNAFFACISAEIEIKVFLKHFSIYLGKPSKLGENFLSLQWKDRAVYPLTPSIFTDEFHPPPANLLQQQVHIVTDHPRLIMGSGHVQVCGMGLLDQLCLWRLQPHCGKSTLLSPPLMSSHHRNQEPLERWHATIYNLKALICGPPPTAELYKIV